MTYTGYVRNTKCLVTYLTSLIIVVIYSHLFLNNASTVIHLPNKLLCICVYAALKTKNENKVKRHVCMHAYVCVHACVYEHSWCDNFETFMHACLCQWWCQRFLNRCDIYVVKVGHTNLWDNHCNWSHTGQPMLVPAKPQFPFPSRSCTHTHTHMLSLSLSQTHHVVFCFVLKDWLVKQNLSVLLMQTLCMYMNTLVT